MPRAALKLLPALSSYKVELQVQRLPHLKHRVTKKWALTSVSCPALFYPDPTFAQLETGTRKVALAQGAVELQLPVLLLETPCTQN